jgi:hypothetical protein
MGLPPVTSAVFLIAKSLVKRGPLDGVSEIPLLSLRGSNVSGMYLNTVVMRIPYYTEIFL